MPAKKWRSQYLPVHGGAVQTGVESVRARVLFGSLEAGSGQDGVPAEIELVVNLLI